MFFKGRARNHDSVRLLPQPVSPVMKVPLIFTKNNIKNATAPYPQPKRSSSRQRNRRTPLACNRKWRRRHLNPLWRRRHMNPLWRPSREVTPGCENSGSTMSEVDLEIGARWRFRIQAGWRPTAGQTARQRANSSCSSALVTVVAYLISTDH